MRSMPKGALLTYDDLAGFPDDGLRRELIDGELIVSPSPKTRHQELVGRLHVAIANHIAARGGGKIYLAPLDVVFSPHNVTEPDLLFIADDELDVITEKNIQGPPSLAIEVLSDPRLDRVRKRDLYARFGVVEYWVVDPDADRAEVYRLQDRTYANPSSSSPESR